MEGMTGRGTTRTRSKLTLGTITRSVVYSRVSLRRRSVSELTMLWENVGDGTELLELHLDHIPLTAVPLPPYAELPQTDRPAGFPVLPVRREEGWREGVGG